MRRDGFSVAELLVVAGVLAIASLVFVGYSTSAGDGSRLELAASEVASALRFARSEAVRSGDHYGARIDSSPGRVRVYRLDTSGTPPVELYDVYHPVEKRLYDFSLATRPLARGVKIASAEFRFGGDPTPSESVAFEPTGMPVSPFDLSPLDAGRVDLNFRGTATVVYLTAPSGRVSVQ